MHDVLRISQKMMACTIQNEKMMVYTIQNEKMMACTIQNDYILAVGFFFVLNHKVTKSSKIRFHKFYQCHLSRWTYPEKSLQKGFKLEAQK